jgi:hypothetical protein
MDVTLKNIPDEITEAQVKEWVGVLVERYHNNKLNTIPAVVTAAENAKSQIDSFRSANALEAKFSKVSAEQVVEKE